MKSNKKHDFSYAELQKTIDEKRKALGIVVDARNFLKIDIKKKPLE